MFGLVLSIVFVAIWISVKVFLFTQEKYEHIWYLWCNDCDVPVYIGIYSSIDKLYVDVWPVKSGLFFFVLSLHFCKVLLVFPVFYLFYFTQCKYKNEIWDSWNEIAVDKICIIRVSIREISSCRKIWHGLRILPFSSKIPRFFARKIAMIHHLKKFSQFS